MTQEPLILIVDDALFVRKMLMAILQESGLTRFVEGTNGEEAVDLYKLHHPDLTLLDISMPGMNGLEALQAIMQEDPAARVIMCSAVGKSSSVMGAIAAGAADFVMKPFNREKLMAAIQQVLGLTPDANGEAQ